MQNSEKKTKIILWAIAALAVLGCALWMLLPGHAWMIAVAWAALVFVSAVERMISAVRILR